MDVHVQCCFLVQLWIGFSNYLTDGYSLNTNNIYSSGCSNERINMECPDQHKIAIKRLFYGVKNDTKCLSMGRQLSVDCCQPTHNDCLVGDDTKYPFLNMLCSGRRRCDIETKSITSGVLCSAKGYSPSTDYMSVIHDCIPDNNVSLCSNSHVAGNLLYISNKDYPQPIAPGNQQCQCLIRTRNHVGIDIYALDIIITRSENGSQCNQDLQLQDDDGHQKVITCGHPSLYAFRNIYNNAVRSVTLTLNNKAPKPQGYVWIQAKAKEDKDILDIYCGNEMRRYLGYPVVDTESSTLDKNAAPHTTTTVQPNIGGTKSNYTAEDRGTVVSDMMALIIGISIAMVMVIIIGLIGIVILCVRQSQDKQQQKCQQSLPPSPMSNKKENKHTSNSYCRYDYDEDKYCAIKRSPMKMTKFNVMDISAGKSLRDAFSQGVSSPELTNRNGYMNCMEHLSASQTMSLMENRQNTDDDDDDDKDDEVIMPKSEYITIGRAIAPQAIAKESIVPLMQQKKKLKSKTVTFSPIAMVTPFPFGSKESVPEDIQLEDLKLSCLEMYSKTMPAQSPDKVKKITLSPKAQDDMCIGYSYPSGLENVTEEDLWKAFKITLNDHMSSNPEVSTKQSFVAKTMKVQEMQEPDYEENPYDNLPYVNVGSLRLHNIPENHQNDSYKEIVKRTFSHEPTMESIPENC